jgi:hypothetical protein
MNPFEVNADLNDTERNMIMIDLARFAMFKSLEPGDTSEFARKIMHWWMGLDDETKNSLEDLARECSVEEIL